MKNIFLFIMFSATLILVGCASTSAPLPPDSLGHYRDTLAQLNTSSRQALTAEYDWNYKNFKEKVTSEVKNDPRPLTLRFCGSHFDWQWGDCGADTSTIPVFIAIAQTRADFGQLNQAMIDYANFLIQFNNANANTRSSLDAAAEKIEGSVKSIAGRFDASIDEAKLGAFSTIGVGIVNQLLAKKQRAGMAAVMSEFHPGVVEFARLASNAIEISAAGIKSEYDTENLKIAKNIVSETDGSKRFSYVQQLISLNEQTSSYLDTLQILNSAYESLPSAHAELMKALQSGGSASLADLIGYIETLSEIRESLKQSQSE